MTSSHPAHSKRRLRNFLLDWRFQLKYTLMVVLVAVAVASVLGYIAYSFSKGQTQALTIQMADEPELVDPVTARDLRAYAEAYDRRILLGIVAGIGLLALALGLTGIIVTHKLIGPARKMRLMMEDVARGNLTIPPSKLRRGDELQDVYEAFSHMLSSIRSRHQRQVDELTQILEKLRQTGLTPELDARITHLEDNAATPGGSASSSSRGEEVGVPLRR